ncbi:DUF6121 family protein [Frondihabitans cladoniiphilus]|uniref:Transmembrane protein n=1 Tax=Frondihabitans cladoniiphilus TaxID=715785 RepID=A0ABP8VX03_9MICO
MSRGLYVIMATITHLGLVVLTAGLVFYITDHDVIVEPDAGTLLGPGMVLGSMAAVFFTLARAFGVAARDRRAPRIPGPAFAAAVFTYLAMLVIGSLGYALIRDEPVWLVLFAARYALSVFVVTTAVWAGVVVAAFLVLARVESARQHRPPRHDDL